MGNGMPISAVVGRSEVMMKCEEVFFSGTFGGETLSLAACAAVLAEFKSKPVVQHLWKQGKKLQDHVNSKSRALSLGLELKGLAPHTSMEFDKTILSDALAVKTFIIQETAKRGVLFGCYAFSCYSHSDEDLRKTNDALSEIFEDLKKHLQEGSLETALQAPKVKPVFRES
jgi:glutamate-1-semialdehyde aminotransferase